MEHIYMRFPGGRSRCLTLSYDDGVQQDVRLCGLMKQYGIAGTFNISTGVYVKEGHAFQPGRIHRRFSYSEATAAYSNEPLFEVATHSATHPHLNRLPAAQVTWEILSDRRNIEQQFGALCRGHAYPYGAYNDQVIASLKACGIVYARTVKNTGLFGLPDDFYQWHPTCHHNDPKLMELADTFLADTEYRLPRLFYLWGHSFEFESDDNWHVIEEFFQKVANRDTVWYATNIEIYDYVAAYAQLIWNADCTAVHNPTATDVWFLAGKQIYGVKAGQTLTL